MGRRRGLNLQPSDPRLQAISGMGPVSQSPLDQLALALAASLESSACPKTFLQTCHFIWFTKMACGHAGSPKHDFSALMQRAYYRQWALSIKYLISPRSTWPGNLALVFTIHGRQQHGLCQNRRDVISSSGFGSQVSVI